MYYIKSGEKDKLKLVNMAYWIVMFAFWLDIIFSKSVL